MARSYCEQCHKPHPMCICHLFLHIDNVTDVIILQHPKEMNHPKGSLPLLQHSLANISVIVGEDFSENEQLNTFLENNDKQVYLVYPDTHKSSTQAKVNKPELKLKDNCLILIDATWKKSFKMVQLSKNLHHLAKFSLPSSIIGQYSIRTTKKDQALSTLEACCYALMEIENEPKPYQQLIANFIQFNHQVMSFRQKGNS